MPCTQCTGALPAWSSGPAHLAAPLEQLHHRHMAPQSRLVQRRVAVPRRLLHLAARRQQGRHNVGMPRRGGEVDGQPAVGVLGADRQAPRGDDLPRNVQLALLRGQVQRGAALGLGCGTGQGRAAGRGWVSELAP